jgi:hypothetical protein
LPTCPRCSASVAHDARTCSACGADLPVAAFAARSDRPWRAIFAGVAGLGVLLLLTCVGLLYFSAPRVGAPPETPVPAASPRPAGTPRAGTPEPTRATIAAGTLLHSDDFSQAGALGEEEDRETRYAYENGAYVITVKESQQIAWARFGDTYANAVTQVEASLAAGPEVSAAALIFRYQDEDNFYIFNVNGAGQYDLELRRDGEWTTLVPWTSAPAINRKGAANVLRVETVDDMITMYINSAALQTISDASFSSGQMALAVNTFEEGGASVTFDNLRVEAR